LSYFFFKAAGGLSHDLTPTECMIKECAEEAQIPKELIDGKLKAVGAIRYICKNKVYNQNYTVYFVLNKLNIMKKSLHK